MSSSPKHPLDATSKKTWSSQSASYDSFSDNKNESADEEAPSPLRTGLIRATLSSEEYNYDAATIRAEFQLYHSMLPKPDQLLQQQHSVEILRELFAKPGSPPMPRFLRHEMKGGIEPHNALCCLLLDDFAKMEAGVPKGSSNEFNLEALILSSLVWFFSFGYLHRQIHLPADFIRDQFYRVAHVIPDELVKPTVLRDHIRNSGLPVPNFFLDPEDPKQFPPHIALLVMLQEDQQESRHLHNRLHRLAWSVFALVALMLRLVLEVIGGAGAIWGGSEVFHLRKSHNGELWRWISVGVGVVCLLRVITLNAPQEEDEGDILGPAGPWSLRTPARLRAVCNHPFHYFCRAQAPYAPVAKKIRKNR